MILVVVDMDQVSWLSPALCIFTCLIFVLLLKINGLSAPSLPTYVYVVLLPPSSYFCCISIWPKSFSVSTSFPFWMLVPWASLLIVSTSQADISCKWCCLCVICLFRLPFIPRWIRWSWTYERMCITYCSWWSPDGVLTMAKEMFFLQDQK